MNCKIHFLLITVILFSQQISCISLGELAKQTKAAQESIKELSPRPLPQPPISQEPTTAKTTVRPLPTPPVTNPFDNFTQKINSFSDTLSKYNSLTSFNDITLSSEWETVQELEAEINTSKLNRTQKRELENKIKLVKGAIARWQINLAARAINQAKEQINNEIFNKITTTPDITKLTDRLETIFYNLVVRFAYGACISLSQDIQAAQKTRTPGEQNLLYHKNIFSSDFKALQRDVEMLNLALVFLFDEASDFMAQTSGEQHVAAHQLALKTLELIEVLEDIYAQQYVSNKKRLLGKKQITKEKEALQQKKALPEIPTTQSVIPAAPPLPQEELTKKFTDDIEDAIEDTKDIVKEISRGDISAQELLNAKNRLEKVQDDVDTSTLPETKKDNLSSTLEEGLANIRRATMGPDEDDEEDWDDWQED